MKKTMQNWSKIPTEILNIITTYCGRDRKKVKWMFVNKRWFTFYLSQIYRTITISFNNEPVINKILNSPYDIGKYVKRINLLDIQRPADLNNLDLFHNPLGMIMTRTPNVLEVNISRTRTRLLNLDWVYLSAVLINVNCWKLQFISTLGENNIAYSANYYTCAYYLRHTLKHLELSRGIFRLLDSHHLQQFIALETLEVHKNLVNGITDIETVLKYMPKLKELIVRFATDRVCWPIKKEHAACFKLKKLQLYNFNPKNNDEILTLVKEFRALETLCIYSEVNKKWLSKIDDPLVIDDFLNYIKSIPKYQIMMPGDAQEFEFSKLWLKSIENSKQDIHLLYCYNEKYNEDHLNFESSAVATFYGGSRQSTPLLKYAMIKGQDPRQISDKLKVLNDKINLCLKIVGVRSFLDMTLKGIINEERTRFKQITFSYCSFGDYSLRTHRMYASQLIKRIIFHDCCGDLLALKVILNKSSRWII